MFIVRNNKYALFISAKGALTFANKSNDIIVSQPKNKSGKFVWGLSK